MQETLWSSATPSPATSRGPTMQGSPAAGSIPVGFPDRKACGSITRSGPLKSCCLSPNNKEAGGEIPAGLLLLFHLFRQGAQQSDLLPVTHIIGRGLQKKGQSFQSWVGKEMEDRFCTQGTFPYAGMPVLPGAWRIHAVVDMDSVQTGKSHHTVKLLHHSVQIPN